MTPEEKKARVAAQSRERHLRGTYGISTAEYDQLLAAQDGRCAICHNQPKKMRLAVDHDHKTGQVRGLLCLMCNHRLLAAAYDSPWRLFNAALYLLKPPANHLKWRDDDERK